MVSRRAREALKTVQHYRRRDWTDELREADEDLASTVGEVMQAWLAGDQQVRHKIKTRWGLATWIRSQLHSVGIDRTQTAINAWLTNWEGRCGQ